LCCLINSLLLVIFLISSITLLMSSISLAHTGQYRVFHT
jgi:hypothetical protein